MRGDQVRLAFGRDGYLLQVPATGVVDSLEPQPEPPLSDPQGAIRRALRAPGSGRPLRDVAPPGSTVAVSVCDVTRPFPFRLVLPVLLAELDGYRVRLVVATGTHRACTGPELEAMFGGDVLAAVEIVQHDADDGPSHLELDRVADLGIAPRIDRRFLEADARVTLGFVEPHFFAGFSGGPKMVAPGLADLATVQELHSARRLSSAAATWGRTIGNPVHDPIRAIAALVTVDFALDVALDQGREITAVFSGSLDEEHARACRYVRQHAMVPVSEAYDVVVTTNSGYPLDQNLYQCVKGLKAAAGVVRPGGTILLVAACEDGLPGHGRYADLLRQWKDPHAFLEAIGAGDAAVRDQWQVQVQAQVQARARVLAYVPGCTDEELRDAWLEPVDDPAAALARAMADAGPAARVAILPDGPQVVAYVESSVWT